MAREKKPVQRVQMTEGKRSIIHQLLDALKALLGGTIKGKIGNLLLNHKW